MQLARRGGAVAAAVAVWAVLAISSAAMAERQVAHIRVAKAVEEGPAAFSLTGETGRHTLRSYVGRLESAAKDGNVAAVMVTFDQPQMEWAQMLELRAALGKVRQAGKPVWVYFEEAGAAQYLLATAADQIAVAPAGAVNLVGLDANMMFFKGLLEKIGVQADMIQVGKFKGAEEPFTRTEPTPELLGQINHLLDGLYDQMVKTVADGRKLDAAKVKAIIDGGPYSAEDALKAKLVDRVATQSAMVEELGKKLGDPAATVVNNYGLSTGPKLDFTNPFSILKMLMSGEKGTPAGNRVGLVYIDGTIVSGKSEEGLFGGRTIGSETICKALDRARTDPEVRAVVVRIDSPGGSALASDVIWQSLHQLSAAKPVVVSVGGMAASGGYYIASAAPQIMAQPTSIVGSIGVVGGKVVLAGLFEKIGITTTSLTRGANAGLESSVQPFTPAQRKRVRAEMDKVYAMFLDRVSAGRGKKIADVNAVAEGRIFLAAEAKGEGMVDEIGGLNDAIALVAGKAKLDKYQVEVMPTPKSLFDVLGTMFGGGGDDVDLLAWQQTLLGPRGGQLELLAKLLPAQIRQFSTQLILLHELRREQVLLAWPAAVEIK